MVLDAAPSSALLQAVSHPKEDGSEIGGTAPAGLLGSHSPDQFRPTSITRLLIGRCSARCDENVISTDPRKSRWASHRLL